MNTKTTVISSTISNIQNWTNFCKLFTYVAADADQKKKGSLTSTQPTNPTLIFLSNFFFKFLMMLAISADVFSMQVFATHILTLNFTAFRDKLAHC